MISTKESMKFCIPIIFQIQPEFLGYSQNFETISKFSKNFVRRSIRTLVRDLLHPSGKLFPRVDARMQKSKIQSQGGTERSNGADNAVDCRSARRQRGEYAFATEQSAEHGNDGQLRAGRR